MNTYDVTMTLRIVYNDEHVDFCQVSATVKAETGLIAADKCFMKNKKAYSNVTCVNTVSIFEYEAEEIDDGEEAPLRHRKTDKSIGFWGTFILKTLTVIEMWVWVDALIISGVYGLWYILHVFNGTSVSHSASSNTMTAIFLSIFIATSFSIIIRTVMTISGVRGLYKRTGRLMTGVSTVLAMATATAVNMAAVYNLISMIL